MLSLNSYDKLLIELGEKSYIPSGSKWPVEVRLFIMIIMNAAFFIVGKIISNKSGTNILSFINTINKPPVQKSDKVKMKGPSIDMSDLKK